MNCIQSLPNEILENIFSFLPSSDLNKIGVVCKDWNEVQKVGFLWKKHCEAYQENPAPYESSYKKRFTILNRWVEGVCQITTTGKSFNAISVIEDQFYLTSSITKEDGSLAFILKNILTNETREFSSFDTLKESDLQRLMIIDSFLYLQTEKFELFCFDAKNGNLISRINFKSLLQLISSDEGIDIQNDKINIWNLKNGDLKDSIDISSIYNIDDGELQCVITPNFYVIQNSSNNHSFYTIDRKLKNINQFYLITDTGFRPYIISEGKYLVVYNNKNFISFEDVGSELKERQSFAISRTSSSTTSSYFLADCSIYKNWLFASKFGQFYVWDMRNGEKIFSLEYKTPKLSAYTNGNQLLIREYFWDFKTAELSLFDFTKIPPPPKEKTVLEKIWDFIPSRFFRR